MNRIFVALIFILGTIRNVSSQDSIGCHAISIGIGYSYHTYVDEGQDFGAKQFKKQRSGFLIRSTYQYRKKRFLIGTGLGIKGDIHRRDSFPLYYGANGWTRGYEKQLILNLRIPVKLGYRIPFKSNSALSLLAGGNTYVDFFYKSRIYEYGKKLYEKWGGSWDTNYFIFQISLKMSYYHKFLNNEQVSFFIEYNRPLNHLDKELITFQEFNIGLSYTLWQSSKTKPPD